MESDGVLARSRHEGQKSLDELEGREQNGRRAVGEWPLEAQHDTPVGELGKPVGGDGWPSQVPRQMLQSQAALFGEHWRDWPRKWVQRICKAAGVPKVTAHAMRGLHGTLAVDSGITSHAVAAALGHESFRTTAESYAQRDAVASAQQKTGARGAGRRETRLLNPSPRWGQSFPNRSLEGLFNRN